MGREEDRANWHYIVLHSNHIPPLNATSLLTGFLLSERAWHCKTAGSSQNPITHINNINHPSLRHCTSRRGIIPSAPSNSKSNATQSKSKTQKPKTKPQLSDTYRLIATVQNPNGQRELWGPQATRPRWRARRKSKRASFL